MRHLVALLGYLTAIIIGIYLGIVLFYHIGTEIEHAFYNNVLLALLSGFILLAVCISIPVILFILVAIIDPNPRIDKAIKEKRIKDNMQRRCMQSILNLNNSALVEFESLPVNLAKAEHYLNRAERDFAEEAFSPFWDSVEIAASHLGYFHQSLCDIHNCLSNYSKYASEHEGKTPAFPITMQALEGVSVGKGTSERLDKIVRKAQSNYQFASIYEQRKINQILYTGFKNLADALSSLSHEISYSIDGLKQSVDNMSLRVVSSLDAFRQESGEHFSDVTIRLDEATVMLNNIQRKRDGSLAP